MDEIPAHLPQEPNSFIGRERELRELRWILHTTRMLTLWGPGGIGKTRLALRLLTEAADEFPDGAWFVELADLHQPDLLVSRVATAIGVAEEPGRPLAATLADALRPARPAACWPPPGQSGGACPAASRCAWPARRYGRCRRFPWPRRARTRAPGTWNATRPSGCSPTGPPPPGPGSLWDRTTSPRSPRSAGRSTACRWPSNWPR